MEIRSLKIGSKLKTLHRKEEAFEGISFKLGKNPIGYGWIINEKQKCPVTERFWKKFYFGILRFCYKTALMEDVILK